MPDRFGRFKGISVPEMPWLREKPSPDDSPCPHGALIYCPKCDLPKAA